MNPNIGRRTVLRAIPSALVGGVGSQMFTDTALGFSDSGCKYILEQDNLSEEVVPLGNGNTVEEFYGHNGVSSNTPTDIERDNTSAVFLWDGPKGISLVVINGKPTSGTFTWNVTFEFDNLPIEEGKWVITDDVGDFDDPETDTDIGWYWFDNANDGGVFRGGLDSEFEITATAESDGFLGVSNLHFLSGNPTDPTRIDLELEREFTIKRTACSIEVDIDIKPSEDTNPINPNRGGGYIPVAILNNDKIDPARVDFESLRFGAPDVVKRGNGAKPAHSDPLEVETDGDIEPIPHWEDVDDDGNLDIVLHFPAENTGFEGNESLGRLEGKTGDGTQLVGMDSATFVGGGSDKDGRKGGEGGPGRGRGR